MEKKPVSYSISIESVKQLSELSKRLKITLSQTVELAIEEFYKQNPQAVVIKKFIQLEK